MVRREASNASNIVAIATIVVLLIVLVAAVIFRKERGWLFAPNTANDDDEQTDYGYNDDTPDSEDPDNEFDDFNAKGETPKRVVGYYTNWSRYRKNAEFLPQDLPTQYLTDIVYAFFPINDSGEVRYSDSWADLNANGIDEVVALRGVGKVKRVLFSIGGWTYSGPEPGKTYADKGDSEGTKNTKNFSDIWDELLRTKTGRTRFINSAVKMMKQHGFDGIDIDYEYPACPQGDCDKKYEHQRSTFLLLLRELRDAIGEGKAITLATAASDANILAGPSMLEVTNLVDYVNVMVYDYYVYSKGAMTGHNQPKRRHVDDLLNVNHTLWRYLKLGCKPEKLNIGVPLYGRGYEVSARDCRNALKHGRFSGIKSVGPSHKTRWTQKEGIAAAYEYASEFANATSVYVKNEGSWLVNTETNELLSYTDISDLKALNAIRVRKRIGGVIFYATDQDDYLDSAGGGKFPITKYMTTMNDSKPPPDSGNIFGKK